MSARGLKEISPGTADALVRRAMDKRRHPRFDGAVLDARLKIDGSVLSEAIVENVSLGGALVALRATCAEGKNVLLELGRGLKLVARVVAVLPRGRGRAQPGLRLKFSPSSAACTEKLYALLRDLPAEGSFASSPTEAFELHPIDLSDLDTDGAEVPIDLSDLDTDGAEVPIDLVDVITDEPTVIDAMAQRIAELERQLATVRRNARTLEQVLVHT